MRLPEAIGAREIIIGVVALAVLIVAAVPLFGYVSNQSRAAEVPLLVESIRAREISEAKHFQEGYVSADWAPRQPTDLDASAVPWQSNEGFDRLGWAPPSTSVYGTYKVAAQRDGFTVTGRCDLDGDGAHRWFEATQDSTAQMKSESGAY